MPPKLMAHVRDSARTYGKSDPIDALAVARAALREPGLPVAQLRPAEREVKLIADHREDLVNERTRMQNRLRWHLHDLDPDLDVPSRTLSRLVVLDRLRQQLQQMPASVIVGIALELVDRIAEDTRRINQLERDLAPRVKGLAAALLELTGLRHAHGRDDRRGDRRCLQIPQRSRVRDAQRYRPAGHLQRQTARPTSAVAGREPTAEQGAPHHRADTAAPGPRSQGVLRPQSQQRS